MKLLALDTSSSICAVAIQHNHKIYQLAKEGSRTHSQFILSMIDECLRETKLKLSELSACIFGQGPGSFTGLRLTASITQALAFSHNIKIIAISSLQAYAQTIYALEKWNEIIVCEDAHIQQVYWAHYQNHDAIMQSKTMEQCTVPKNLIDYLANLRDKNSIALVGSGWEAYPELNDILKKQSMHRVRIISIAAGLLQLGVYYLTQNQIISDELALPSYVQALQFRKKN